MPTCLMIMYYMCSNLGLHYVLGIILCTWLPLIGSEFLRLVESEHVVICDVLLGGARDCVVVLSNPQRLVTQVLVRASRDAAEHIHLLLSL